MIFHEWTRAKKNRVRITYCNDNSGNPDHFWVKGVIRMAWGQAVHHTVTDATAKRYLNLRDPRFKLVPKPSNAGRDQ